MMSVLVLAGMIGAGKSTYTKMISNKLGTQAFYESVDYNPILGRSFSFQGAWAFATFILENFVICLYRELKELNLVVIYSLQRRVLWTLHIHLHEFLQTKPII